MHDRLKNHFPTDEELSDFLSQTDTVSGLTFDEVAEQSMNITNDALDALHDVFVKHDGFTSPLVHAAVIAGITAKELVHFYQNWTWDSTEEFFEKGVETVIKTASLQAIAEVLELSEQGNEG